jgi:serine/threonine protein kinase
MNNPARDASAKRTTLLSRSSANSSLDEFLSWARGIFREQPANEGSFLAKVGRFEILGELGRGTFGVVLLARDPALGCERALKIPTALTMSDDRARAKFLVEARLAASIDHPHVVRVLEADEWEGLCYLVMEYCPDGSLSSWLRARPKDRPFPERWAAMLVSQIADGVHEAHVKGVLHRDLKPGNVLLVRVGPDQGADPPQFLPKVADFGLATLMGDESGSEMSIDGSPVGTYAYMSPEQARGSRKQIGRGSDVHALGAILFELLAGARVYPHESREELLDQLLGNPHPPSLRVARPSVSRELEIICRTCLAKDPRDRYPTASALAEDLRRFHRGDPIRGTPVWKRAYSWMVSHRAAMAGSVLVLALGGIGLEYKNIRETNRQREAETWLVTMRSASIEDLPRLLGARPELSVDIPLREMARSRDGAQRLAASVAMARSDATSAGYAVERLLSAPVEKFEPLLRALRGQMPNLIEVVRKAVVQGQGSELSRANAALALVHLQQPALGFSLLQEIRDPGGRAHFVHRLGPSGIAPGVILHALADARLQPAIRRGLLLALGEIPAYVWSAEDRTHAEGLAKRAYSDAPDSGVHGAAKWLLRKWEIETGDLTTPGVGYRPGFRWRVGPSGLTFIRVVVPSLGREIECCDTELTVNDIHRLGLDHRPDRRFCPGDDCPATGINWLIAAGWCNAIGVWENLPTGYGLSQSLEFEPFPGHVDRPGLRMPTATEFETYCRAGTPTDCYFGDALGLASFFAHHDVPQVRPKTSPVGLRKPNDLGLFDTLGNAFELGEVVAGDPRNRAILLGGSVLQRPDRLSAIWTGAPFANNFSGLPTQAHGVRLVNTLAPHPVHQ